MAQGAKTPKILFFLRGVAAEPDEQEEIDRIVLPVSCRNAGAVGPDDYAEPCEAVGGAVPKQYDHLPRAAEIVKAHFEKLKSATAKVGDKSIKAEKPNKVEKEALTKEDEKPDWEDT